MRSKGPLGADQAPADDGLWHGHAAGLQNFIPNAKHCAAKTYTKQIELLNC